MSDSNAITEADILKEIIDPELGDFPSELAKLVLRLRFSPAAKERLNELAEKNRRGILSSAETSLLEKYLRVGNFLNLVQAKARVWLSGTSWPDRR
ncbi:MAG: hypothetical protein L0215_24605 [Gemmataceae bacterium]|nr:hypothetical protein [Gemmataceae bacterium]